MRRVWTPHGSCYPDTRTLATCHSGLRVRHFATRSCRYEHEIPHKCMSHVAMLALRIQPCMCMVPMGFGPWTQHANRTQHPCTAQLIMSRNNPRISFCMRIMLLFVSRHAPQSALWPQLCTMCACCTGRRWSGPKFPLPGRWRLCPLRGKVSCSVQACPAD